MSRIFLKKDNCAIKFIFVLGKLCVCVRIFTGHEGCVEVLLEQKGCRCIDGNPFTPLHCAV